MVPLRNDMEKTFQKNLQFFSPEIKEKILSINKEELWKKIMITRSADGYPVCKYKEDGRIFHITSSSPIEEAKTWIKNLHIDDAGALFIYGSGFAYPLFEILNKKQPNTIVVVFEQNPYIFKAMLYFFDLEPLFHTQKFSFFVGNIEDFSFEFQYLFNTDVFLYTTAPFVTFTPVALRNFKKIYKEIHQYVFKELSLNIFYMGNDHFDTLLGFHNLIANVTHVIENPYLNNLKGKYFNFPAFIIANGPSLDKNIEELKKISGRGIIISTESAIVPLMKHGIKPDLLCVLERTKDSYDYHFESIDYPEDISLLALALIDKHIFPSFPGPKIPIFRNTESINRWMNSIIGDDNSSLDAGANVSHLAFEIAAYLGANPIVLVGQDYAFSPDGVSHSKDAIYLKEKGRKTLDKIRSKPVVYTESNEGTILPTTQLWLDFKQGLERKIMTHHQIKVINATEGGAKIKGTAIERLSTTIDAYCKRKIDVPIDQLIKESKNKINKRERRKKLLKLIEALEIYEKKFRKLSQIAIKGRIRSQQMLEAATQENAYHHADLFEKAHEEIYQDLRKFMKENLYFVFFQQVLIVGFHQINRLGLINSLDRVKKIFQIYDQLFAHLHLVSQSVTVNFEMAIDQLQSILAEQDDI